MKYFLVLILFLAVVEATEPSIKISPIYDTQTTLSTEEEVEKFFNSNMDKIFEASNITTYFERKDSSIPVVHKEKIIIERADNDCFGQVCGANVKWRVFIPYTFEDRSYQERDGWLFQILHSCEYLGEKAIREGKAEWECVPNIKEGTEISAQGITFFVGIDGKIFFAFEGIPEQFRKNDLIVESNLHLWIIGVIIIILIISGAIFFAKRKS